MGPYSPDGQAMGGFLVDGQPPHFSMRHPAWPSGSNVVLFLVWSSKASVLYSIYLGSTPSSSRTKSLKKLVFTVLHSFPA